MSRFKPRFVMMEATAQPIVSKPFTCLLFDLRQKHFKLLYLSPAFTCDQIWRNFASLAKKLSLGYI